MMGSTFETNRLLRKLDQKISCLVSTLNSQTVSLSVVDSETYDLEAGQLLEKVVLNVTGTGTFEIGTTPGGSEIYSDSVTDGETVVWILNYYLTSDQTIYFTGNADVKLYIR